MCRVEPGRPMPGGRVGPTPMLISVKSSEGKNVYRKVRKF